MARASLRVGLLWHSASSGNLGVGALTVANLAIARDAAASLGIKPHFTIIGMRDGENVYVREPDVDTVVVSSRSMANPAGVWATMGKMDCVLDIGGGDSFAEIYGAKRFTYIWLTKWMALKRGKPLLLSPQTIGPFEGPNYKKLARYVLDRAHAVVARDRKSFEIIEALAPGAKRLLATDVALALPYRDRSGERGQGPLRVGVNISGLLVKQEAENNRFALDYDYMALTRQLLGELTSRTGVEVHLIAHTTESDKPVEDDGRACDLFAAEFPKAVRVPNFAGPSEAKSHISSLDFLVAPRMHACVGAYSSGVPVVPISYSRKFSGLFGSLGYNWMVSPQGMGTEAAVAYILDALDRREELARDIAKGMPTVSGLLDIYRNEVKQLFARVAR
jgi:polysaccharide pyruvyl transferase WcaK-like protein